MNEFERTRRDCQLSIKTCQNLQASHAAFDRLCNMIESNDHLLISSIFHMAVIKYAKPFLNNESGDGPVSFPIKGLKKNYEFNVDTHKHLVDIRNTLIAHDDFQEVMPKILLSNINVRGSDLDIPMSVIISNKCVSHPAELAVTEKFTEHVKLAFWGAQQKLSDDLGRLRKVAIEKPQQAKDATNYTNSGYDRNQVIPKEGASLNAPDFMSDDWLHVNEPDFSEIHNGFCYEEIRLKRDFNGPEKIKLPNGFTIEITPN